MVNEEEINDFEDFNEGELSIPKPVLKSRDKIVK